MNIDLQIVAEIQQHLIALQSVERAIQACSGMVCVVDDSGQEIHLDVGKARMEAMLHAHRDHLIECMHREFPQLVYASELSIK